MNRTRSRHKKNLFKERVYSSHKTDTYFADAFSATLREAVVKIISEPTYVERQAQGGSEITPCTSEEMRRIQVAEINLYREMMKIAGIEPE